MRVRAGITAVLARAYASEPDELTWLEGIRHAASEAFDGHLSTQAFTVQLTENSRATFGSVASDNDVANDFMFRMHQAAGPDIIRAWYRSGPVVNMLGAIEQSANETVEALLHGARSAIGHSTVIGAVATDPNGRACALTFLPPKAMPLPRATRSALARVAGHLASAYRLRGPRRASDAAVLDPNGKLLHAADGVLDHDGKQKLRNAAAAIDRARRKAGTDPATALGYWRAMVDGRWTLVERFESDGRRILVARPNQPATRPHHALTETERMVIDLAALCHPSKLIAYELGFSTSSVSLLLGSALTKLGLRSRAELIEVHRALVANADRRAPPE